MDNVKTWMNLKTRKVTVVSHKRPQVVRVHLYEMSQRGKLIQTERR